MDAEYSELWALEKEFWLGGAAVYRRHLAEQAVMVFPGMVLTRQETIASIENAPRWTAVEFSDQRVVRLTDNVVGLLYRASATRGGDEQDYVAIVSSVYVLQDQVWKLALHQQTPELSRITT